MGSLFEYIKMAIKNIKSNKGRSFLTMLGIIIGISSVIMIVSLGGGFAKSMNSELSSLGGGQISISVGNKGVQEGMMITEDDVIALKAMEGIQDVVPMFFGRGTTETSKGEFEISYDSSSHEAVLRSGMDLKTGRLITEEDVENKSKVVLLRDVDAVKLFGSEDVLDMTLEVKNSFTGSLDTFTIVGIVKMQSTSKLVAFGSENMPISLMTPWTTVEIVSSPVQGEYDYMMVYSNKTMDQKKITESVLKLLESRHQVPGKQDYFKVDSFQNILEQINQTMSMMTTFVAFVGTISLLVGGIGVMNIMLVSVTERTREIGIRKSLGAKTSSILTQFLAESAILTIIGGIIGIVLGILGASGIGAILGANLNMKITPDISVQAILTATFFSTAVGIFFGLYPANKAAKLNPIEALRRE